MRRHTDEALKELFDQRDFGTDLQLSLNKNRMQNLGSNHCNFKRLDFLDGSTFWTRMHSKRRTKAVDLNYLRKMNRKACKLSVNNEDAV